jgi:hypothetical protein
MKPESFAMPERSKLTVAQNSSTDSTIYCQKLRAKESKLKIESQSIQMRLAIGRSTMTIIGSESVHRNEIMMMMTAILM